VRLAGVAVEAAAGDGLLGCAADCCGAAPTPFDPPVAALPEPPPGAELLGLPELELPELALGAEEPEREGAEDPELGLLDGAGVEAEACGGFVPTETEPIGVVAETVVVTGRGTGGSETVVVTGGGGGGKLAVVVGGGGGGGLAVVVGGGGGGSATVVETVAVVIGVLNVTVGVLTEMVGSSRPQDEATNPCETKKPSRLVETSARMPPIRRLKTPFLRVCQRREPLHGYGPFARRPASRFARPARGGRWRRVAVRPAPPARSADQVRLGASRIARVGPPVNWQQVEVSGGPLPKRPRRRTLE
jgi:hypothetical protein